MEQHSPAPDPLTEAALRSLKDIAMPPPVSWMPQTWGWALVMVMLIMALLAVMLIWRRRYKAEAYRREALRQLALIERQMMMRDPLARQDAVHELARLLKQVALAKGSRSEVASLSGAAWIAYMDSRAKSGLGTALRKLLDDGEYHGPVKATGVSPNAGSALMDDARTWIEENHVSN